jgi:hypothetical protein
MLFTPFDSLHQKALENEGRVFTTIDQDGADFWAYALDSAPPPGRKPEKALE